MQADLYVEGAQTAIRFLVLAIHNPKIIMTKDERLHLEQFMADLQDALDNEAERDWLARNTHGGI